MRKFLGFAACAAAVAVTATSAGPALAAGLIMKENGTYVVGVDLEPGLYEWSGFQYTTEMCTWERLGHGRDGNLITLESGRGMDVIVDGLVIKRTDAAFVTTDCNGWKRIGDVPTPTGSLGFLGS